VIGIAQPNDRRGPESRPDVAVAAAGTIATTRSAALRGSDVTVIPVRANEIVTVPSRSVRYTRDPTAANRSIVDRAGCPYRLPAPADATATFGRTAFTNDSVVAVRLP
jgi:hypothetical protein